MSSDGFTHPKEGDEKKGPWSADEDEILRSLYDVHNPKKWGEIAEKIKGRTPKQCRERWEQNLKPGIKKGAIDWEEASMIMILVDRHGKKWAQIARDLGNRSDNTVKNWYNGMLAKYKSRRVSHNMGNFQTDQHFSPEHQDHLERLHGGRTGRPRVASSYSPTYQHHPHRFHPYPNPHHSPPQHSRGPSFGPQKHHAGPPYPPQLGWDPETRAALMLPPMQNPHYEHARSMPQPAMHPLQTAQHGGPTLRRHPSYPSEGPSPTTPFLSQPNSRSPSPSSSLESPQTPVNASSTSHLRHPPKESSRGMAIRDLLNEERR